MTHRIQVRRRFPGSIPGPYGLFMPAHTPLEYIDSSCYSRFLQKSRLIFFAIGSGSF